MKADDRQAQLIEADQADEEGRWEWAAWLRIYAWRGADAWMDEWWPNVQVDESVAVWARRVPRELHVWGWRGEEWTWTSRRLWRDVHKKPGACPPWVRAAVEKVARLAVRHLLAEWEGKS